MTTPQYVRAMGVFEIFRSAFELYRRNFRQFFLINVIFVAVGLIFSFLLFVSTHNFLQSEPIFSLNTRSIDLSALFLQSVHVGVGIYLFAAAVSVATSEAVLGRPISVRGAYRRVLSTSLLGRFFLTCLLVAIIEELGFAFFIIPGIVFMVWLLFVPLILMLEKVDGRAALGRSWKLMQGNFWRVLLALGCYYVPVAILSVAVAAYLIVMIALGISLYNVVLSQLVTLSVTSVIGLLIGPIGWLIVPLLYYDVRARKENYNEELLAGEIGYTPPGESVAM